VSAVKKKCIEEWVKAAEKMVFRSAHHVECPECGEKALKVRDIEYGRGPCRGLERYLMCSHCGAYNIVNLRHALSNGLMQTEMQTNVSE
jgi:DNA-directed RNA polymerase subunit RPC12/RpoP